MTRTNREMVQIFFHFCPPLVDSSIYVAPFLSQLRDLITCSVIRSFPFFNGPIFLNFLLLIHLFMLLLSFLSCVIWLRVQLFALSHSLPIFFSFFFVYADFSFSYFAFWIVLLYKFVPNFRLSQFCYTSLFELLLHLMSCKFDYFFPRWKDPHFPFYCAACFFRNFNITLTLQSAMKITICSAIVAGCGSPPLFKVHTLSFMIR
jgi:hypothetical protein